MGRKTLNTQVNAILFNKQAFGESRHQSKKELREKLGDKYRFGMTDDKIHSIGTFNTYKNACNKFADWLIEEKNLSKYTKLEKCEKYAKEYIEYRLNENKVSVWTAKMERAALGKLFAKQIDVEMPKREVGEIKRSRGQEKINHFSEKNNCDIVNIAKATGCRRCDLLTIRPCDFWEDKHGNLWVDIDKSKGGRFRSSPVLPVYKDFVKEYINDRDKTKPLFEEVKQHMDVHAYRDKYAVDLYKSIVDDRELQSQLLKQYPMRHEYKTVRDKATGEKKTVEIKSKTFTTRRGEDKKTFVRDDVYIVSQALGHNRLDVTITHYLFNV